MKCLPLKTKVWLALIVAMCVFTAYIKLRDWDTSSNVEYMSMKTTNMQVVREVKDSPLEQPKRKKVTQKHTEAKFMILHSPEVKTLTKHQSDVKLKSLSLPFTVTNNRIQQPEVKNAEEKYPDTSPIFTNYSRMPFTEKRTTSPSIYKNKTEAHHVVLLKVAKTGSTTMTNIFLRFAESRNLTVALSHSIENLSESSRENVISFKNSLTDQNIVKPPPGRHYEMLCSHVIYNHEQMRRYFPEDTVYVGIVREPIQRLESAIRFYNMYTGVELADVGENPFKYNNRNDMTTRDNKWYIPRADMSNNRMAFEFGFPRKLFPTSNEDNFDSIVYKEAVKKYINVIDNDFKIILINEKMDESIILMKRLLHWTLKDVLHLDQNVAKNDYHGFPQKARTNLERYLYFDFELYKFALQRFKNQVLNEGPDFPNEVNYFKIIQGKVEKFCLRNPRKNDKLYIKSSKWNDAFSVNFNDCLLYETREMPFTRRTRIRLYNTTDH